MNFKIFATFKERYQYQLRQVVDSFKSKISPKLLFENDDERNKFISDKVALLESKFPDSLDSAYEEACVLMSFQEHTEYQYLCYTVSLLYHIFEQQLIQVFYNEFVNGYDIPKNVFCKNFKYANDLIEEIKRQNKQWWDNDLLTECRLLNNAIKHGIGKSLDELKIKYPHLLFDKYLQEDDNENFIFKIEIDNTVLEKVFNISIDNLDRYLNNILQFWIKFPSPLIFKID